MDQQQQMAQAVVTEVSIQRDFAQQRCSMLAQQIAGLQDALEAANAKIAELTPKDPPPAESAPVESNVVPLNEASAS